MNIRGIPCWIRRLRRPAAILASACAGVCGALRASQPGPTGALAAVASVSAGSPPASGQPSGPRSSLAAGEIAQGFRNGYVLARPRPDRLSTVDREEAAEGTVRLRVYPRFGRLRLLAVRGGESVTAAVSRLRATGRYSFVEPDYLKRAAGIVPNDPDFSQQWALSNAGTGGGTAGDDIHAESAWTVRTSAAPIIVAVIDSGVRETHQDLAANLWVNPNPGQAVAGSSDTDGLHGLNAITGSGEPADDLGHGTHVSGIIGAVGNNGVGVSGVAWTVQLMELKFLNSSGFGSTANEITCIDYAISHGASVINASFGSSSAFGGGSYSQSEESAIYAAQQAGIIWVSAAGNNGDNNDLVPVFPADYLLDNTLAVGASDNRDAPAGFSDFGSGAVDLFAPGVGVLSTYNTSDSSYEVLDGTSMATPFVTGSVALLRAQYPGDTYRETINRILGGVDRVAALAGLCQTGGRLDLATSLNPATSSPVPANSTFEGRFVLTDPDPVIVANNADSPATPETGTPQIAGTAGGHSLWWQWTAPVSGAVSVATNAENSVVVAGGSGSSYSTLLAVYTGSSLGSLALIGGAATTATENTGPSGAAVGYSVVQFQATAGTAYQINVQGQAGASGQTVLSLGTLPGNDQSSAATGVAGRSWSVSGGDVDVPRVTAEELSNAVIRANSGSYPLWWSWTAPASGQVQVGGYSHDFTPQVAVYSGTPPGGLSLVASGTGAESGTVTPAGEALATFTVSGGTTYYLSIGVSGSGSPGTFSLTLNPSLWQANLQDAVTCSPAVAPNGTVYVGGDSGTFYALNPSGSTLWSYATTNGGDFDTSSAAIAPNGTVYAGCSDGRVYAFQPGGGLLWTFAVPTPSNASLGTGIVSSPAVGPDGTVYVKAADGNLYALGSGGSVQWTYPVPGVSYAAPAVALDGTIIIGTDSGELIALNPLGDLKWEWATPAASDSIYTAVALDAAGNAYFGTLGGNFYSVTSSGHVRWSFAAGASVSSAPALASNGTVYFGCYDDNLYALSGSTGALGWKCPVGNQVRASAPAVDAAGNVYVGSYDCNVYEVAGTGGAAGSVVQTFPTQDWVRSSPAISGTTLYVGSNDHRLYAFPVASALGATAWPTYMGGLTRTGLASSPTFAITAQPASQAIATGAALALFVEASGPAPFAFQWFLGGTAIPGATGATYGVPSASAANSGSYSATVTDGVGSTLASATAQVTVSTVITAQPVPQTVASGSALELSVAASGQAPLSFQWFLNGTAIVGASSEAYQVNQAGVANAGSYCVAVTDGTGSTVTSAAALVAVTVPVSSGTAVPGWIANLSVRGPVQAGGEALMGDFTVAGTGSKDLLLRGAGPALAGYGLANGLPQPLLSVYSGADPATGVAGAPLASAGAWGGVPAVANLASELGAFAFSPSSADAAYVQTLSAGSYTLAIAATGSSGVALGELYDADGAGASASLTNLSALGSVGTGSGVLIAGFVIGGNQPVTVLVRGVGPGLAPAYGLAGLLAQPQISLFSGQTRIAGNAGWGGSPALAAIFQQAGAFPLAQNPALADAALAVTLMPGAYTVQVSGAGGATGLALAEIYLVP